MRKGTKHNPQSLALISASGTGKHTGCLSANWNGGRTEGSGYVKVLVKDHPRADPKGYVLEHRLVAERALGKLLPADAQVHHFNGDKKDNSNRNLVICQDAAYHHLLHIRQRVVAHGGDPNRQAICSHCQSVKDFSEFNRNKSHSTGLSNNCRQCFNKMRTQKVPTE